jgi:hypothetical protein
VAIPWLIREIGQREGGVYLHEVGLELLSAHHADSPRGGFQSVVCQLLRVFLFAFRSIHLAVCFWLHKVWWTVREVSPGSPFNVDGPRVEDRLSVFQGAVLEVREAISDRPQ